MREDAFRDSASRAGASGGWAASGALDATVHSLANLAQNDDACRLLGVFGVLEGQLDIAFVNDPLEWLAFDIGNAIIESNESEDEPAGDSKAPQLATLVAEYRLCRVLLGEVSEIDLIHRVRSHLERP